MAQERSSDDRSLQALWEALGQGARLRDILIDFYGRVYEDPRLSHFFEGVTKERAIEKQYNFLRDKITGSKDYFGDRPRNAHHWMVISHELFDYREELLEDCMRRAGLAEEHVARWRSLDEVFRKQIVKDRPIPKKLRGVPLPLDGYETLELSIGTLCDGCGGAVEPGEQIRYHNRTGKSYCPRCVQARPSLAPSPVAAG